MVKVCFFIDGFNLYHALKENRQFRFYKWLDLRQLAQTFIKKTEQLIDVFYFTAYTTWNPGKVERHTVYVKALEARGVKVVLGAFREKEVHCPFCHKVSLRPVEKETDVNIAIKLFQEAILGNYDKAFIISGDSDLLPAIRAVKQIFPTKQIGVVIPIGGQVPFLL